MKQLEGKIAITKGIPNTEHKNTLILLVLSQLHQDCSDNTGLHHKHQVTAKSITDENSEFTTVDILHEKAS